MPTGDAKSLYEQVRNEGRYKRSHQKEYLKLDLYKNQKIVRVKSTAFIKASLRLFESSLSPFSFFVEEDQLANSKSTKMDEACNIFVAIRLSIIMQMSLLLL